MIDMIQINEKLEKFIRDNREFDLLFTKYPNLKFRTIDGYAISLDSEGKGWIITKPWD